MRGRLPTWVVRMRSRLKIMKPLLRRAVGLHNSSSCRGNANDCCRSMRARRRLRPPGWARSRATTISPPTSSTAISRPAAPTSRPSSIRAAPGPTAQLADRVARFAASLRALGVRREERVLIALLDTIDWPTAFLGCLKAGVVAVPVNTLMTEDDYRFMLADSRARVLVVSDALYPRFQKLIGESRDLEHVIVSGEVRQGPQKLRGPDRIRHGGGAHRADRARRYRVLALHLGLDRQAQGRGACPRGFEDHRRSLWRAVPRNHREAMSAIPWRNCSSPTASATR